MLLNRIARKGDAETIFITLILFIFFGLPIIACAVNSYLNQHNKLGVASAEATAKVVQEENNRRAIQEQAARRNTISGVVKEVTFSSLDMNEWTRVVFQDGREKSFSGLPTVGVKAGDDATFVFDDNSRIVSVKVN